VFADDRRLRARRKRRRAENNDEEPKDAPESGGNQGRIMTNRT